MELLDWMRQGGNYLLVVCAAVAVVCTAAQWAWRVAKVAIKPREDIEAKLDGATVFTERSEDSAARTSIGFLTETAGCSIAQRRSGWRISTSGFSREPLTMCWPSITCAPPSKAG